MPHIEIISSSVRTERKSDRIALYFKNYLEEFNHASCDIVDLKEYSFPLFNERLRYIKDPSPEMVHLAKKIETADGVIIVTPEYNGGYPASLKNVIDLLYDEWYRKPVAISTVSEGMFGGTQVIVSLQFLLWKIHAWTVPAMFPVPKVSESFDKDGNPTDKKMFEQRAASFINELLWCIEAKKRMQQQK